VNEENVVLFKSLLGGEPWRVPVEEAAEFIEANVPQIVEIFDSGEIKIQVSWKEY
jgi:hypothetical protein